MNVSARFGGIAGLACLMAGACSRHGAPQGERTWEVPEPRATLELTVQGQVAHRSSETIRAPVSDLRLAWMASEGSLVEAGEVVARYDTELLDLWLQANREELAILERRTRAAELEGERELYTLRARLIDTEADRRTARLAWERSQVRDASERGILERELTLSRERLADAREKLESIQEVQRKGGAAGAEVREAMAAYERALANVRIPEINLAEFDELDGSRDRLKLEQNLVRLGLALAPESQHGSLRSRIASTLVRQERDLMHTRLETTRLIEEAAEVEEVVSNAVTRSDQGGLVNPGERDEVPLVPGAELGAREIVHVIAPSNTVIRVWIPEALREAVRVREEIATRVLVRVPSLGPDWLAGRLVSVGVIKDRRSGELPAYRGVVELDSWPPGLNLGAGVECRISLPVPDGSVVIPRWWGTREFRPVVRMQDGETRRVDAQPVGDWLLVSTGLAPGDRILPPRESTERDLVLFGTVQVPDRLEITLESSRSWEWEVAEIVEDGRRVVEGQVVMRLRRTHGRGTTRNAAEIAKLKADMTLELARMTANGRLGTAFMDWQDARIDTELARVDYEIDRRDVDESSVIQAEVGVRLAAIEREQAEDDLRRLSDPVYQETRSTDQRARDRLDAEISGLNEHQAGLAAASARHGRNWPATWSRRLNWQASEAVERTAEQAYQRARNTHRRDISSAEAQYARSLKLVKSLERQAAHREITSPASGRIYHNRSGYRPIEVGRHLPSSQLLNLPRGTTRRFELNVPSRRYRDFAVGQELPFYLPAEGSRRQVGRVVHVADFFEKRTARPRRSWRHRGGDEEEPGPEQVETTFRITVEFEADQEEAAPPGMTVVVEVES